MEFLTKKDIDFIKSLSKEMKEQDNRGSSSPYGYLLMQEEKVLVPKGYGEEDYYYSNSIKDLNFNSRKEFWDFLKSGEYKDYFGMKYHFKIADILKCGIDMLNTNCSDIGFDYVPYKKEDVIKPMRTNFFLTEKAYNDYIKRDRHNLTNPSSWVTCLLKNPEMEKLYSLIHKIAENCEQNCE